MPITSQKPSLHTPAPHLPGSILAISAQRLPSTLWASQMMRSSSSVQQDFFTSGLRWLCQRSRHCFPSRPFRCLAMRVHCFVPYFLTSSITLERSFCEASEPRGQGSCLPAQSTTQSTHTAEMRTRLQGSMTPKAPTPQEAQVNQGQVETLLLRLPRAHTACLVTTRWQPKPLVSQSSLLSKLTPSCSDQKQHSQPPSQLPPELWTPTLLCT